MAHSYVPFLLPYYLSIKCKYFFQFDVFRLKTDLLLSLTGALAEEYSLSHIG